MRRPIYAFRYMSGDIGPTLKIAAYVLEGLWILSIIGFFLVMVFSEV